MKRSTHFFRQASLKGGRGSNAEEFFSLTLEDLFYCGVTFVMALGFTRYLVGLWVINHLVVNDNFRSFFSPLALQLDMYSFNIYIPLYAFMCALVCTLVVYALMYYRKSLSALLDKINKYVLCSVFVSLVALFAFQKEEMKGFVAFLLLMVVGPGIVISTCRIRAICAFWLYFLVFMPGLTFQSMHSANSHKSQAEPVYVSIYEHGVESPVVAHIKIQSDQYILYTEYSDATDAEHLIRTENVQRIELFPSSPEASAGKI